MENQDKVCYLYVCLCYPQCARGRGCCIEYPENDEVLVNESECRPEDGYPLFIPVQQPRA